VFDEEDWLLLSGGVRCRPGNEGPGEPAGRAATVGHLRGSTARQLAITARRARSTRHKPSWWPHGDAGKC